jgi:hypothetical protein
MFIPVHSALNNCCSANGIIKQPKNMSLWINFFPTLHCCCKTIQLQHQMQLLLQKHFSLPGSVATAAA